MTISDLGSLGEFVSSFAVLITLVYLAVQTRQARTATQASVVWERARASRENALTLATNVEAISLIEEFGHLQEPFPSSDNFEARPFRYLSLNRATLETVQASHLTAQSKEDEMHVKSRIRHLFTIPGFRATWPLLKETFHPGFAELVEAEISRYSST